MKIDVPFQSPKMLRETLCVAQASIAREYWADESGQVYNTMLQHLINQLDAMRALGVDGKHGDLHTANCGCEDT